MDALVDTNVLVDIYRNYPPAIIWMKANSSLTLGISPIVWLEMTRGTVNKLDLKSVTRFLDRLPLVYPTDVDIDWALRQFSTFHLSHQIETFDCLIAAPAHRLQLTLYTRNLKHMTPLLGVLAQQPY